MKKTISIEAMHGMYVGELQYAMSLIEDLKREPKAYDEEDEGELDFKPYKVFDGVGVYNITGPLLSNSSWFSRFLGYTSYDDIRNDLIKMSRDPDVEDIVINMASPGGSVFGVSNATEAITKVSKIKPLYVYSSKNIASGAYWIAAPAKEILVAPEAEAGSIGVIVTHISYEKQLEDEGLKVTILKSDELKAAGGPYKDLTEKEIAHIQVQVDQYDDLFKQHVQTYRPQVKLSSMKGQTFIGDEAVRMGLADKVMTYDDAIDYIKSKRIKSDPVGGYTMKMTLEELKVALDAGKTIEDLGLTREEFDEIRTSEEGKEVKDEVIEPTAETPEGEVAPEFSDESITAEVNARLSEAEEKVKVQDIQIADLTSQLAKATEASAEMKSIICDIINNRRVPLGLSKIDMTSFSLESVMGDYKAVTAEYNKAFIVGGLFKKQEEPKTRTIDSTEAGLMQAAAIR